MQETLNGASVACVSTRDRSDVADDIRRRIISRLHGKIYDLSVDVGDGEIVLSGRCHTFYTKQLAQHVAMGAVDDERLINQIRVCS